LTNEPGLCGNLTTLGSQRAVFLNYVSEDAEAEAAESKLRPRCQTRVRQKRTSRRVTAYVARPQTRTRHPQGTDLQPAGRAVHRERLPRELAAANPGSAGRARRSEQAYRRWPRVLTEPFTIHDLRAKSASDDAIDEALGRLAVVRFSLGGETEVASEMESYAAKASKRSKPTTKDTIL